MWFLGFLALFMLNLTTAALSVSADNYSLATWNGGLALLMLVLLNKAADEI